MKVLLNKNNHHASQGLQMLPVLASEGNSVANNSSRHRIFSTADLWNIQRQTKYRALRRFI